MYVPFAKDTLQKLSLISFAQAILDMMDDSRQVIGFYPTEMIIPTFRKRLMDGVLLLEDGTLMDIEFQSGNLTEKFLLRCAQYAINLRVLSGKLVETNIISTGIRKRSKAIALISRFFPFKPKLFFYSEFDGKERLISIKNKIKNNEKLTLKDRYSLIFIPLMSNVNPVEVAFEVFKIANNKKLFNEDERSEIKKCQYIIAQIIADDDEEMLQKFWEIIRMNNDFLEKYETELLDKNTQEVTHEVTKDIAKNFKDIVPDEEIVKRTGLTLEEVQKL